MTLQAPIDNPAANKSFLKFLPGYGAEQVSIAGGFTHIFAAAQAALALMWFAGFLLISLSIFYLRTRRKSSVVSG